MIAATKGRVRDENGPRPFCHGPRVYDCASVEAARSFRPFRFDRTVRIRALVDVLYMAEAV